VIFNQFEEFGKRGVALQTSPVRRWPKSSAGSAAVARLSGYVSAHRPALARFAAGDYLRNDLARAFVSLRPRPCSVRRCINLVFGGHRIEGIGDKHVPWIHNVSQHGYDCKRSMTSSVWALLRLFNDPHGPDAAESSVFRSI